MEIQMQIITFLFLMLGPFKIVGPFAKITQGAEPVLIRKLAIRSIIFASIALLLAGVLGQIIMRKYGIPMPILGIAAGIILFLVALLNIIQQFTPAPSQEKAAMTPSLNMAMNPIAFPTIVTPYGIAAVIMFLSVAPDLNGRLYIAGVVLAIMMLNLIIMLITRYIFKVLSMALAILGSILGVVQVALGLLIIYNQLKILLAS
jgi:multiple antibiotic resistance protein